MTSPSPFQGHYGATVSPHLVELTSSVLFGDVWERPQLSKRDRSIATVALLISKFRTEELKGHVARALANGVTRDEIGELVLHIAFYAGWPTAASAVRVIQEAYDELDAARLVE